MISSANADGVSRNLASILIVSSDSESFFTPSPLTSQTAPDGFTYFHTTLFSTTGTTSSGQWEYRYTSESIKHNFITDDGRLYSLDNS